jgi:hypothetical protein
MSQFDPDRPIEVNASALPAQAMSLLRDALVGGTAWLVGQGYIDQVTGTQLVSVGLIVGTIAWRQFVTWRQHRKLVTTASAAPNSVARVK